MNNPDYSTTLSPPPGRSDRLMAVLREFMIFHEFEITPLPEGGFNARKVALRARKHDPLIGLSELRVTPMGREVLVEADLSRIRTQRVFLIVMFIALASGMCLEFMQDRRSADKLQLYIPLMIVFPLIILAPMMAGAFKKRTINALERIFQMAINIVKLP